MALTNVDRGTGTHNTGATTVTVAPTSTIAAGSMGVLCIALDNAGNLGASTAAPTTATDSKGNVWTLRQNPLFDNGAASAGIEGAIYTAPITVAFTSGDTLVLTWIAGVSPVAKAWTFHEITPAAGNAVSYVTGNVAVGGTSGTPTVTTSSVTSGHAVIGAGFAENTDSWAGDADATNGAWSAHQHTGIGSTTSAVSVTSQVKVVSATATQSYDPTRTSSDCIVAWIEVVEAIRPSDAYGQAVFADRPDIFYRLSEGAGTAAVDVMGGANGAYVGTPTLGATTLVTGGDAAVTLNGSTQRVNAAKVFNYGNGPWSYELWFQRSSAVAPATSLPLFAGGANSGGVSIDNGGVHGHGFVNAFKSGVSNTVHSSSALAADTLVHYCVLTKSAANVWTLYVDGVDVSDRTGDTADTTATTAVLIGFGWDPNSGNHFAGTIDDAAVYTVELTSAQVATHYAAGTPAAATRVPYVNPLPPILAQ